MKGARRSAGACKTEEVCLPGFRTDLCSSVHGFIQTNPVLRNNELGLLDYGLEYIEPDPIMHISFEDKSSITVWKDLERTIESYAEHSIRDAETFRRLFAEWRDYRSARAEGRQVSMDNLWKRRLSMSSYDLVHELFEDDRVRSFHLAVGRFSSVHGGDPNTGKFVFNVMTQQMNGRPIPKGGSGELPRALGRVIQAHGGIVLTNRPVVQLIIEGNRCAGVDRARMAAGSMHRKAWFRLFTSSIS